MESAEILAAPNVESSLEKSKWERERRSFFDLRPMLVEKFGDKYVVIHEGQVVDSGDEKIALALRAYARFGQVSVYIGNPKETSRPPVRVPSPSFQASHP